MGINAFTAVVSHTHEELKNIEIGVSSGGSNAGSAVSITIVDKDGTNYAPTDWLVTSAWTQTAGAPDGVEHTDRVLTDPLALGWNKEGVIRLKYVGSAANGTSAVIYNGVSGAADDGIIKFNFEDTDYNVQFASKDDITIVPWEVEEIDLPVEARDNNTISVVGKTNWRFQDDVIGPTGTEKPAVVLGERYADAVINFNRGDAVPANPKFTTEVFLGANIGRGPEWLSVEGGSSERNAEPLDIAKELTTSDIIRYTVPAGGPFVTGAPQSNTLAQDAEVLLSPLATIAANTLTDPMTIADVLLFTEVSESELSSGALRRLTVTASDVAFVDETYNVDYSVFDEQLFESEIYAVGPGRILTFGAPVRSAPQKTRIHRVFINANTADTTIKFAPGTWKKFGTADDAADVEIPSGENKTLEFTSLKAGEEFVRVLGEGSADSAYDETSVAEYSVAWGGANGGSNANSSSVYVAPDDIIELDHDGDYTFDVLPYQTTLSQENGTATGGIFYLKNNAGSTIEALTFPWKKRDSNYTNFPYEGGRQTIFRANMTAGTYRLGFTSHGGSGGGNRVSYNGYAHVIVRRSSLKPSGVIPATLQTLVVTSPTATPDIEITEEQAGFYTANVTAGQQLVLGATADVTVSLVNPEAGVFTAQATGPSPTVTFTEVAAPATAVTPVDYMPGDNVEFEITGKLFGGKQVYGRSFDRNASFSGSDYTWISGGVDDVLGVHGLLPSDWGSTAITGSTSSSGSTDGTYDMVFRKVGANVTSRTDRSMGSRPVKFWVEYTKT